MSVTRCISIVQQNAQPLLPDPPEGFYKHCKWPFLEQVLDSNLPKNLKGLGLDIYGTLVVSAAGDISLGESRQDYQGTMFGLLDRWGLSYSPELLIEKIEGQISKEHEAAKLQGIRYPEVDIRDCWKQVFWQDHESGILSDQSYRVLEHSENLACFATDYETVVNPVAPMPGLKNLLDFLNAQDHVHPGIVSNAQFYTPLLFPAFTGKDLEAYGFDLKLQIYSYQVGRGKPSIHLYKLLAQAYLSLNISPSNVLFVGNDLLKDCWAASQAGFMTGLFAGDSKSLRLHGDDHRGIDFKPDVVFRNLSELVKLIGG